ncbi:MAG TPA: ATP-binding protein [Candidatus Deferrimicrobium sp.]|nr:ATP-binding protein [Candidatus Deferrimicrobium sp.]
MLGVSLFRSTPGIPVIKFDYEIRKLAYTEFGDIDRFFIAGGDEAGLLKILRYDEEKIILIGEETFGFKIIDIDFVIYGKCDEKLGLLVSLEKQEEPNIYFYPDINQGYLGKDSRYEINHGHGIPQLAFQPYIIGDLSKLVFSFQNGDFVIGELLFNEANKSYRLELQWSKPFTSRIMDVCVEFPKNIKITREANKDIKKNNAMYIASKAGDIMILKFDRANKADLKLFKIKTISSPIRTIIPINRINKVGENITGILGIAGSQFFVLYCKKSDKFAPEKYRIQQVYFKDTLHSICVGSFKNPYSEDNIYINIIFIGDSKKVLHAIQFSDPIDYNNVPELLLERRKIFRENLEDRALDIIPIDFPNNKSLKPKVLFQLALGLGNHTIIFKDLLNKNHIIEDINNEFSSSFPKALKSNNGKLQVDEWIELARKYECHPRQKCKLIVAIFDSWGERPLALQFLADSLVEKFIELIYWLLSSAEQGIYIHFYKLICDLIQNYYKQKEQEANKLIYEKLNQLLEDIEKFWIGGDTYSRKQGDIFKSIEINQHTRKLLDKTIYQAYLNDRAYAVENSLKVSNEDIQSICQIGKILFASDNGGALHFLRLDDFLRIGRRIRIVDYNGKFYGNDYKTITELDRNFIRKIVKLPGDEWGVMLLRSGGIWIFPIHEILGIDVKKIEESPEDTFKTILDIVINDPRSRLIGKDIFAYSLNWNKKTDKVYIGDRLGQLYELEFKNGYPDGIKELYPEKSRGNYNPIWNFDFLIDGKIVFGDRLGVLTIVDPGDGSYNEKIFPTSPYFNSCLVCNQNTVILGTEDGNIVALDYSSSKDISEIQCIWTYNLPGPVRFIEKTDDDKLLIGGICGKAVIMNLSGKMDDSIDFEYYSYKKKYRKHPVLINRILPLSPGKNQYPNQRFIFITGDTHGKLRMYRLFRSKIFEDEINKFFFMHHLETDKIKMRCIDIRENALRRLFTAYESKSWDFAKTQKEIERIAHIRDYNFFIGPMMHLIPHFINRFIDQYKDVEDIHEFQKAYDDFQNTVILLNNSWGIETDVSCQQLMIALGVGLFQIMIHNNLFFRIRETVKSGNIPNMRGIFELMDNVHVHSISSTLIDMYEEIRGSLNRREDSPYMEAFIEYLCQRFQGRKFDKLMPDSLLLKKVEIMAVIVDNFKFCPIKLSYRLFNEDADINIFHYLAYKVKNNRNKNVFETAYNFHLKLQQHADFSMELDNINKFKEKFPENFDNAPNGFYTEFSFLFDRAQRILNFTDALDISISGYIPKFENSAEWFKDSINLLDLIIENISQTKGILEKFQNTKDENPIPRHRLIELREDIEKVPILMDPLNLGDVYKKLIAAIVDHIGEILTFFCEVTLPIQTIERTATYLEKHLSDIREKDKPLPTWDNPETVNLYNFFFKKMFDALVVGLNPQCAYLQCQTDVYNEETKFEDFFDKKDRHAQKKSPRDLTKYIKEMGQKSLITRTFNLYLPDFGKYYGEYWVGFIGDDLDISLAEAKLSRFDGLVKILNLYIVAFNGMNEAEMQSRFIHRLFAHQTKEPILTIRRQLELLTGAIFLDTDGSKTKNYYQRMLRIVDGILNRIDNILNANKRSLKVSLDLSEFDLYSVVDDVVENMRKVMDSLSIDGEIKFVYDKTPGPIYVYSDENKIREILEQLIKNSIKYCMGKRKIIVKIGYDSRLCYLTVEDNGLGIPDHELPYIFKKFFRGQISMEKNIDGDGLGLWVLKTYADALGEDIRVKKIKDADGNIKGVQFEIPIKRKIIKIEEKKEDNNE